MAENNPIHSSSRSSSYDSNSVEQLLSGFTQTTNELRAAIEALQRSNIAMAQSIRRGSSSSSSSSSSNSRADREYERSLRAIQNATDTYAEADRIIKRVSQDLYRSIQTEVDEIKKGNLSTTLYEFRNGLTDYNATIMKINNLENQRRRNEQKINELENKRIKLSTAQREANFRGAREESLARAQEITEINKEIAALQDVNTATRAKIQAEQNYKKQIEDIRIKEAEAIEDGIQSMTNLSSRMEQFRPEASKKWDNYVTGIKNYLNPKGSAEYKEMDTAISERATEVSEQHAKLVAENVELDADIANLAEKVAALQEQYNLFRDEGISDNQAQAVRKQLEAAEEQLSVTQTQKSANENMLSNLDRQADFLDEQRRDLQQSSSLRTRLIESACKFVQKWVTKAVDRELDNLQSAASDVFNAFETLQKSLGKQLKMSSGEYDDMKDKLIAAANAAGKSIDVTQLTEAAASMSEMGIANTDLISEMAVGIAKLSEAGISAKLDEESAKQINATFSELVAQGMDEKEAAKLATQRFDDMIGIQEQLRQQYGNTIALENGGWQEIQNWVSKLQSTEDLTNDEVGSFMASTANALEAMTTAGISDPTLLLGELENVLNGKMSDQNKWMLGWMDANNFDINDTEAMYQKLGSAEAGDIMVSLADYLKETILKDTNATNAAYVKDAYGISMTGEQLRSFQNKTGSVKELYTKATFDDKSIDEFSDAVVKGLEDGKYLTATEGLQKTNISLMQELASKYQDIPDGAFWMGEGFNEIRSIVDGAMDTLFTFLTMALTSNNLFGGLGGTGGAGGGAGGNGGGGFSGSRLTGSASAGNPAAYGTMAVGGVMSAASAVKNFTTAEDFEEGMINTFRDPTFTAGLGTTIGGAVGGPIGGAIGGALGSFVPTVSKALEDWLCSTVHDPVVEGMERQTEQLEEATKKLADAAAAHQAAADNTAKQITEQQAIFSTYDDNQKANFIKQMEIDESQYKLANGQIDTNKAFNEAIEKWVQTQVTEQEKQLLLSEGADQFSKAWGTAVGIDNEVNTWKDKSNADKIAKAMSIGTKFEDMDETQKQAAIDAMTHTFKQKGWGTDTDKIMEAVKKASFIELDGKLQSAEHLGSTEMSALTSYLDAYEENEANNRIVRGKEGYETIEKAKQYAKLNDKDWKGSSGDAMREYLSAIGGYDEKDINTAADLAEQIEQDKSSWEAANNKFHDNINEILRNNPNITNYQQLFTQYAAEHDFAKNAVEGLTKDSQGNYIYNGSATITGSLPDLAHSARGQFYEYDPRLYEGKYMTGLDYVPIDNFLALLHQGEMVLNKSEADTYRNSFDATAITNSVDTQTDKLIEILTKIMQLLVYRNNAGSNLPRSLVNMNSDIALL